MKNVTTPPSWFSSQGRRSRNDVRELSQRFDGRTMASDSSSVAEASEAWSTDRFAGGGSSMRSCTWSEPAASGEQLPHDFPKWKTVYTMFWRWRRDGVWQQSSRSPVPTSSPAERQEADAQRGDHRQPVDSHGRRGRRTRLRCGQKDHRPQAAPGGRHAWGWCGRWSCMVRTGKITTEACFVFDKLRAIPPLASRLCRQRLRSQRPARLGPGDIRLDPANRAAARPSERLRRVAEALDRRTHVCLAGSLPPTQQGLRTQHRHPAKP